MELLRLSKFRLQLRSLVAEVRDVRERERATSEQLHLLIQKQKEAEEEYGRKLRELESELASSSELRQKLERKVTYLQNDNELLENKQKELKGTIHGLLQSRDSFLNAYEESTCEMKRSIDARDRKIAILSEKINSHLSLFDSIEKEALTIKQVVENVHHLVGEKEQLVACLKSRMDHVSTFEIVFVEKIYDLENKLKRVEDEFRRRHKTVAALEAQLEAAKVSNNYQLQIEELKKTLSAKDAVIQNLISEKMALHSEVKSLGLILQKIQETVANMKEEKVITSILIYQGQNDAITTIKDNCELTKIEDLDQILVENSLNKASNSHIEESADSSLSEEYGSADKPLQDNNKIKPFVLKLACSPTQSTCFEPHSAVQVLSSSIYDRKDNCTVSGQQPNSEGSTTQAVVSETHGGAEV
ncbi:hyaluronan mediated motility receptor [Carica papaya]|uniref:hyaluronan mediated motility receptor n=1 Tax=Carica papaya TaxID=3649 RepID=UPI000B8CB42A|nr:hyaluronan mediated motility receptor [Carica papaya]